MSTIPANLRYTESHEWVLDNGDGTVTLGITDHAQQSLGDVVFVELPEVGATLDLDGECGVVESVKAASDIFSPLTGEVVAVNESLADAPEAINEDPYGDGWIFKLKLADAAQLDKLLDADSYAEYAAEDDH